MGRTIPFDARSMCAAITYAANRSDVRSGIGAA